MKGLPVCFHLWQALGERDRHTETRVCYSENTSGWSLLLRSEMQDQAQEIHFAMCVLLQDFTFPQVSFPPSVWMRKLVISGPRAPGSGAHRGSVPHIAHRSPSNEEGVAPPQAASRRGLWYFVCVCVCV